MKVVDGKAMFPINRVVAHPLDSEDKILFLRERGFIDCSKDIYDLSELNSIENILDEHSITYSVEDAFPIDTKDANSLTFNTMDELVSYLVDGIKPRNKTIEQLEDEINLLENALLTIMFSGVN